MSQRPVERISQAAVRVRVKDNGSGFDAIRAHLLEWLQQKAGQKLADVMLRGETDSLDLLGAQRVETVALEDPKLWAARQDFQDESIPRRTWVTEAMLASGGPNAVLLGFRLTCVTLGDPAPFFRTVPRFMRTIARDFEVRLDGVEVDLHAAPVETEDETDALVGLLTDQGRRMPVVGVSMEELAAGGTRTLIDGDQLASNILGTAHIRVLSRAASYWLTDRVGKRLSVFNGAVRIWQSPVRPDRDDPYDHPLWLADRIEGDGQATRRSLVNHLLRMSVGRRDADEAIPSFAQARRTASTLVREMAADTGRSADELLPLYEAENARLSEEIKEAKAEQAELLEVMEEDRRAAISSRDEARTEIYSLRVRLEEMTKAMRVREQQPEIAIPDNFDDLGAWAAQYISGSVLLLPRAMKTAKKSVFEDRAIAYRVLLLMRDAYVPMRLGTSSDARERWESGLRLLGLTCSPTQDSSRAGEHESDYFVEYFGRRRELDMHIKGNNSRDPRYCFRLYFFWSDEKKCAVVGSLPSHLGNRIT